MNMHKNARLTPAGRALLIHRIVEEGGSVRGTARLMGVSASTAYKWIGRFEREGPAGLEDRSSRPHHSPTRISERRISWIERLRRRKWTGKRIARRVGIAVSTVSRWLRHLGLGRLRALEPREPVVRYERSHPGELVHLDTKKLGRFDAAGHRVHGDRRRRSRRVGWEYLHVAVDDATRLAYIEMLPDERAVTATGFLARAVAWYEAQGIRVEEVMTDNGSCYVAHLFRDTAESLGIRLIYTRPYRPQTNGKAERFIRTALEECLYARSYGSSEERAARLPRFQKYYNQRREHSAIGHQTPASRLRNLL